METKPESKGNRDINQVNELIKVKTQSGLNSKRFNLLFVLGQSSTH